MKNNESLIETIMVYLQEKLDYEQQMGYSEIIANIPDFIKEKEYNINASEPEIKYALKKAEELKLIEHDKNPLFAARKVSDITCGGHRFLCHPNLYFADRQPIDIG
jgi:hypothetical protein